MPSPAPAPSFPRAALASTLQHCFRRVALACLLSGAGALAAAPAAAQPPAPAPAAAPPAAEAPGWRFSVAARELRRPDGSLCHLTSAEFELLRVLYESQGEPVARAALSERVFGRHYEVGDRAVDTVVKKLRQKVQPEGESTFIQSVRPIGYVFVGFPP